MYVDLDTSITVTRDSETGTLKADFALAYLLMSIDCFYKPSTIRHWDSREDWKKLRTTYKCVAKAAFDAKFTKFKAN